MVNLRVLSGPPPSSRGSGPAGHRYLTEAEFAIKVLVHLLDHGLQAQVGLGGPQLLHHQLQLHQVNEAIPSGIIPVGQRQGAGEGWPWPGPKDTC